MKVKEILIKVTKMLELKDVEAYLTNETLVSDCVHDDIGKLILAVNMVNSIIASQYFEIVECVKVNVANNFIKYSDVTEKNIIDIKEVYDSNGAPIEYELINDGICVKSNNINVKFSYFPNDVTIDDSIDHYTKINDYVIAQGIISEYLFLKGDFEESYIWDKRFKNSISALMRSKRNIVTPAKRWL